MRHLLRRPFLLPRRRPSSTAADAWTAADRVAMARALALARGCLPARDVPVGACVVRDADGAVLGAARNRREADQQPGAHAETLAIAAAADRLGRWRLDTTGSVTLYVTLEPCVMCYGAAALARVGRVVYGAPSDKFGASRHVDAHGLPHRPRMSGGLLAAESADLLRTFFRSLRDEKADDDDS